MDVDVGREERFWIEVLADEEDVERERACVISCLSFASKASIINDETIRDGALRLC